MYSKHTRHLTELYAHLLQVDNFVAAHILVHNRKHHRIQEVIFPEEPALFCRRSVPVRSWNPTHKCTYSCIGYDKEKLFISKCWQQLVAGLLPNRIDLYYWSINRDFLQYCTLEPSKRSIEVDNVVNLLDMLGRLPTSAFIPHI